MTTRSPAHRGVPSIVPLINPIVRRLLRLGMPMGPNVLLTVVGRTSGQPHTFPIALMESDGHRYVGSPYGEVNWVRNLRADGHAVLHRGRRTEPVVAVELDRAAAGAAYQASVTPYLSMRGGVTLLRRFYPDVPAHPTPADLDALAETHPLFELRPA
jgi:deazaflavin-dependent oxidoreductase (nitroreductase family)